MHLPISKNYPLLKIRGRELLGSRLAINRCDERMDQAMNGVREDFDSSLCESLLASNIVQGYAARYSENCRLKFLACRDATRMDSTPPLSSPVRTRYRYR